VDRLTTGRRHHRAGSVSVTELLTRQAPHCADSSPTDPDDDVTDTIPVVVESAHRREPAKGAQLAKLASLGVAGMVLCGAVTVSSMIAHQRREHAQQPQAVNPAAQITGEQALLPDKLDETLPKAPHTPLVPEERPEVKIEDRAEERPAPVTPRETAGIPGDTTPSGGAMAVGAANDIELVREFYASLPDSPGAAFGLLSPDVLKTSLGEFLESWAMVTSIDSVDLVQRADGVLATVRMRLLGGGELRIQQLLTVAESPRRIVGVQLLSAQRN
jgi:hypothetical protein